MTALELAERVVDDLARVVRSGEWTELRPLAVFSVAQMLKAVEQSAYERGVADGQALAALNPNQEGD